MLEKINQTFFTGLLIATLNFIGVWLSARYLGGEGRGVISLFILNSSFVQIFTAIVGSSSIIYLQSKHPISNIILLSLLWNIIVSIVVTAVFDGLNILQKGFFISTALFSIFQTGCVNNALLLLGKKESFFYNLSRLIQPIALISGLSCFAISNELTLERYFQILLVSSFLSFLISSLNIVRRMNLPAINDLKTTLTEFLKIGTISQLTNCVQLLNSRFTYYLIAAYCSIKDLGSFSVAMAIIDGIWILKNSIALIHHSEVVHIKDLSVSSKKTKQLAIFSLLGTSVLIAIACLLPQSLYVFIFGKEFKEIKTIILLSSPGVLSISTTSVIAYFFSALGLVKFNTISSCIGLLVIMPSGLMLISSLGINGAAIANALSFLATSTSLIYFYYTHTSKMNLRRNQ